jgi:hypothetical protein
VRSALASCLPPLAHHRLRRLLLARCRVVPVPESLCLTGAAGVRGWMFDMHVERDEDRGITAEAMSRVRDRPVL